MIGQNEVQQDEKRKKASEIVHRLKKAGFEAYFVGGCVRDFVRGVVPKDYDIVTSATPDQTMALFERTVAVGARFGVILVIDAGHPFEVATFRSEEAYRDGRRPERVRFATSAEDVWRRDFTVNGLLMDPDTNDIVDHVGGLADLQNKVIRAIGDPVVRFSEDYLRMLRAVRFAANLEFSLDPGTENAICKCAAKIQRISAERILDELDKILTRGGARRGFDLLLRMGILQYILPEVERLKGVEQPPRFHPEGDVWTHTMLMLDRLSDETAPETDPALAWGALLHDIGKPLTKTVDERGAHFYGHVQQGETVAAEIALRLKFPRALRDAVVSLIHHHMIFMNVTKMRPARLRRFLRMDDFARHLALHRLDCLASHQMLDHYEFCREQLRCLQHEALHPPRLLTGDDLIAMGMIPGKTIGTILKALEEEQLEERIQNRQQAEAFVKRHWPVANPVIEEDQP